MAADQGRQESRLSSQRWVMLLIVAILAAVVVLGGLFVGGLDHPDEPQLTPTPSPTPDIDPTPTPVVDDRPSTGELEQLIHAAVNDYRQEQGLSTLEFDDHLASFARNHSADMYERDFFDHDNPDSDGPEDRVDGYCSPIGENLAINYWDRPFEDGTRHTTAEALAEDVVQQWIDSPGHRELLEHDEFGRQGIGVVFDDDTNRVYVTQKFCP